MKIEIQGSHFLDNVFEEVQAKWEHRHDSVYRCSEHDITFNTNDPEDGVCWQCWDKCWEKV